MTTLTSSLLLRSRSAAALTQAALGRRVGVPQSSIARAERGRQDLTVAMLARLVAATGNRLTIMPGRGLSAADAADAIRCALEANEPDLAFRTMIQLADDLAREHGAERVASCVSPPRSTGDVRYDAFLAGLVETRLVAEHLPLPIWLAGAPVLSIPWVVAGDWLVGDVQTVAETPDALRSRGVIIAAEDLVSL